jgi:hypothetical protein
MNTHFQYTIFCQGDDAVLSIRIPVEQNRTLPETLSQYRESILAQMTHMCELANEEARNRGCIEFTMVFTYSFDGQVGIPQNTLVTTYHDMCLRFLPSVTGGTVNFRYPPPIRDNNT